VTSDIRQQPMTDSVISSLFHSFIGANYVWTFQGLRQILYWATIRSYAT